MLKEKIEQLTQKHKGDNDAIDKINNALKPLADCAIRMMEDKVPSNKTINNCKTKMTELNAMCAEAGVPAIFPKFDILTEQEIANLYISPLAWEYIDGRKK